MTDCVPIRSADDARLTALMHDLDRAASALSAYLTRCPERSAAPPALVPLLITGCLTVQTIDALIAAYQQARDQ